MGKIQRLLIGDNRDARIELGEVFGVAVPAGSDIQPEILRWARTIVDPAAVGDVEAIKRLRRARPELGLKSATFLVRRLSAQPSP